MIKPNWNIFRAKFNENPQNNFEWFCYLLFCKEFQKPVGIFRYKNQAAIETSAIEKEGEFIGWQAKFYDAVALSDHKSDLISTIDKAKKSYPTISKIIFYTNQEWGQNKGKEPQGKIEVEAKARELNIKLDWRTASFFESPFVSNENEIIAKHFFSLDKSIFDLLGELQRHSLLILDRIQHGIFFNSQTIEIDRTADLKKIEDESKRVLIVSGAGGVGKTALIKKFYEQLKETTPFYILKATEFELRNINDLFPGLNAHDFVESHKEVDHKIIVIDSAEKLLDLKNPDPFKEFLTVLLQSNWKLIFTTRDSYLEDLNYQFFEIYRIAPLNISIQNLDLKELQAISDGYKFTLPKDVKLLELIRNPFYLNEYLKFYKDNEETNYVDFKNALWNKIIKKAKPAREQCFMQIALERATTGHFFVNPQCESKILDEELTTDGVLGYESPHGYFITHDIYEEWALGKIVELEFYKKESVKGFFEKIGSSLPIRRSFRNWLSEKLLLDDEDIKKFIEEVSGDNDVVSFWKDETFVSVLLSDHSENLFSKIKERLLENEQQLLKKLTFLLRIACKEVDEDFFKRLGIKNIDLLSAKYVFTKPKGQGWKFIIKFVFDNLQLISIKNIGFILPIIHDWNSKFKQGETTRLSSLIALQYYQWLISGKNYYRQEDTKAQLLKTVLYGSSEIETELKNILEDIHKNKWKKHRDPYYDLSKLILTTFEGMPTCKILPKHVLQLADLFWSYTPNENDYRHSNIDIEEYFGMEDDHTEYFPSSSYQTPIYWLLQFSLKETIDFILNFTNKAVEHYAKSGLAQNEVNEADVFVEDEKPIKQYISNRLWCIYRGTQVAPHALESIHMAMEKFFLEHGEHADSKTLEIWLLYLLRKTNSASISALVASICLAYPEKTFNAAKILFKTKKFFFYDTSRLVLDQSHKSSLLMLKNSFGSNPERELHENERLEACDAKHRSWSLENLFLKYQFFRSEETSEEEAEKRQKTLWDILDKFYAELPITSEETESDKTWRLYLARMDRRKMKPTTKKREDGLAIYFNPEIEQELKEYSEKSLEQSSEPMKHTALRLWANYRLSNDDKYKQYEQYENNPQKAFTEIKEIVSKLKGLSKPEDLQLQHTREESFYLLNHSIPADVCAVMVRDYFRNLSTKDRDYCKNIVIEYAKQALHPNYRYQMSDGTRPAISVLPILFQEYPEEEKSIKAILLLSLFNDYPVDMAGTGFSFFSIMAFTKLWENNFQDAHSLLIGYLLLKPKYDVYRIKLNREKYSKKDHQVDERKINEYFFSQNEAAFQKILGNNVSIADLEDISKMDLRILKTAFQLIPSKTENKEHKIIVNRIIDAFAEKLLSKNREDRVDYRVKHDFLNRFAFYILTSQNDEIQPYLKPFLDNFNGSESIADLFEEFISTEDFLNSYKNFWVVWDLFKNKIIELCKDGDGFWYVDKIVINYLFAGNSWKEAATEWHTFKKENAVFFKEISGKIGHCPSALYALSRLLNGIGSSYLSDGVSWISDILKKNKNMMNSELKTNTVYYMENFIKKFIYENREKIKRTMKAKQEVLTILDALIEKGSVVGYMLREIIL